MNRRYLDYLTDKQDKTPIEEQNLAVLNYSWGIGAEAVLPKQADSPLLSLRYREIQLLQVFTSLEAVSQVLAEFEALASQDKNAEHFYFRFLESLNSVSRLRNYIRAVSLSETFLNKTWQQFSDVTKSLCVRGNFAAQSFYLQHNCTSYDRVTERERAWIREGCVGCTL